MTTWRIPARHGAGLAASQPPRCRLGGQPVGHRSSAASRQNIDQPASIEIHDPGDQQCRMLCRGCQERRLVQPDRRRRPKASQVIDTRLAVIPHRGHRCVPARPKPRAARATDCSPGPTRRAISARARSVSTARGLISSDSSDQVPIAQAGSGQRHSRLAHTNTTGRSARGRSRTLTRRRFNSEAPDRARGPESVSRQRTSPTLHRGEPLCAGCVGRLRAPLSRETGIRTPMSDSATWRNSPT